MKALGIGVLKGTLMFNFGLKMQNSICAQRITLVTLPLDSTKHFQYCIKLLDSEGRVASHLLQEQQQLRFPIFPLFTFLN